MKAQRTLPHCGIIFLHPYINLLFSNLELLENKKFKSHDTQIKAVQLLYFLANSKIDSPPQLELEIFRRLIGISSEEMISFPKNLTAIEKKECIFLLESFIDNWAALKNCNVEIVQKHFLRKQGVILEIDETFEIVLEKNSTDLLLNTIPFSYSFVKVPWLNHFITTRISD
ncbi:contractile injection system tape measure protein [Chryseobacterium sp. MP_3.2]|uniref:contractile injection system tape measure protein n=1 Tax=Chryseobacterium sp. MP_3.2 TaxID=3071712 RepID=UPI002DFEA31B|nr:hypothetical protein [Chryseobacterium sp. MP_3.2]